MPFIPIPDESSLSGNPAFTRRKIRKAGDDRVLEMTERLLAKFIEEGEDMLSSDLNDLVHALHRTAIHVQRVKQALMLKKLRRTTRTNVNIKE